ncbi:MAG: hypothetical protein OK456_06240 [Thaumarchaeota archaeon]|nr:hypothetical protein [Nitrososphaerota archaeon]
MTSNQRIVRNSSSVYWIRDEGIMVFRTLSSWVVFGIDILLSLFIANLVTAASQSLVSGTVAFAISYLGIYVGFRLFSTRRLSRISKVSLDRVRIEIPPQRVIPWETITQVRIDGSVLLIQAGNVEARINVPKEQTADVIQFVRTRIRNELISDTETARRLTKPFILLVLTGATMSLLGIASFALGNLSAIPLVIVGPAIMLDASMIFALQNPRFLAPIPRLVAYFGLVTLSCGILLWIPTTVVDSPLIPFEYAVLAFSLGGTLCAVILGRVLRVMIAGARV